jgi:tRNA pseudouridine synthase 10
MTCKGLDKGHIKEIIKQCNDDLFIALVEKYKLFELMNNELKVTVDAIADSVYLKGSYLKFSREVGQSPWTINNVKVCATSVQDEIRNYLRGVFDATDVIMHAGGREDRDVRMLGSGRPLMLEIVNPKAMEIIKNIGDVDFVREIQKKLNNTTELIQLVGLESCEKGYIEVIKKYEDSKIKNYTSVVYASKRLSQKDIDTLNAIKDLEIVQKTPVRVAHRRTLMDRKKMIISLKAQLINEHFMILDVVSSAGTYIKEFVHSDLGRTSPSVVSLLGCDCDIIQLDVTNIIVEV